MARRRIHLRRWLVVVAALLLLLLLFEMNRFFPGTWPGGGQQGSLGLEPGAVAPLGDSPTPIQAAAPAGLPHDWPPRQGIRIRILESDGHPARGARLGVGQSGPEAHTPDREGDVRVRDREVVTGGLRARGSGGVVQHRGTEAERLDQWVVYLPATELAAPRRPGDVQVRILRAEDQQPLPGAQLLVAEGQQPLVSDAAGEVRLPLAGPRLLATISAPGRRTEQRWLSGQEPGSIDVPLFSARQFELPIQGLEAPRLLDALSGAPIDATLHLDAARGRWHGTVTEAELPHTLLLGQRARVGGSEGFAMPLAAAIQGADPPRSRPVRVRLLDELGQAAPQVKVVARAHVPLETGLEGLSLWRESSGPSDVHGEALLHVAEGAPFTLRIADARFAPQERAFLAQDGSDTIEWTLLPALQIPVEVTDAGGKPIADAFVLARQQIGQGRAQADTYTDAGGRADIGPFATGPAEVFVRAPGFSWARAAVTVGAAMATTRLALEPGDVLRLVVEDPQGRPLQGVRVLIATEHSEAQWVEPPIDATLETDAEGQLRLENVPATPLALQLMREGYHVERLHRVRAGPVLYFATLVPLPR